MIASSHWLFASEKRAVFILGLVGSTALYVALQAWFPAAFSKLLNSLRSKTMVVLLCGLFFAGYAIVLGFSTAYPGFLTSTEPHVASLAYGWLHGAPLYHGIYAAQRYSLGTYGPMVYLPYALALRLFGARVLSLRLVVLLTNIGVFAFLWKAYRQILKPSEALVLVVAVFLYLLNSVMYNFQFRGDLPLVFFVAVGLWAVLACSGGSAGLLLALAAGLSCDIKITAPLYFLPL
jgi:Dolichyl-phosphate-mannose-protein mannosyltransferase